ncbi:MAG: hypothetical protein JW967_07920 [Dehalococcoidales bacterium]|nr:hypothetical protein [Dehalococcoidales bacterium]
MEAKLGVITCDKCGKLMKKDQKILIIAEGAVAKANEELDVQGSEVRYTCHLKCWDGVEEKI